MKNKLEVRLDATQKTASLIIIDDTGCGHILFNEARLNGGCCSITNFMKIKELLVAMVDNMNSYREVNGYDSDPIDGPSWVGGASKSAKSAENAGEPKKEVPKNRLEFTVLKRKLCPSGMWDNGIYVESVNTVSFPLELLKIAVIEDMPNGVKGVEKPCSRISISNGDTFLVVGKVKV